MPSKRTGGTTEEEINDFTRRMIDEIEDFDYYYQSDTWKTFVNDKFTQKTGRILTHRQLESLEVSRLNLVDFQQALGVKAEFPFKSRPDVIRYRDVTGEFQKTGTFVSRSQIAGRIDYLKRFGL